MWAHSTTVPDLDWEGFVAAYFPGSRRHDLKAITAYAAYNVELPRLELQIRLVEDGVGRALERAARFQERRSLNSSTASGTGKA